jgi:sugar phosphate permease
LSRYRWVVLAVGTAAQASFSVVLIGTSALAPALQDRYDLGVAGVGVVLAAASAGMTISLLPWGIAADRVGERLAIALGLSGAAAALVAAAFAPSVGVLVALLAVAGLAGASVNAASGRAVMHWFGAEERGLALGLRQASLPLGGAFAAVSLPLIVGASSLDGALVFLAALCVVSALVAGLVIRDRPRHTTIEEQAPWTLRDRRLWLLSLGSGLYLVAQIALTGFVVLFLHDARGLSIGKAAAVLAVAQAVAVCLRIAAGRWSDMVGARVRPLRLVGLAIFSSLALSAALVNVRLELLVPMLVVATALSMTWNGLSYTAAAELAGSARSGAAIGFQQMTLSIIGFLAAPIFAALVDTSSWRTGFAVFAAAPLAGWWLLGQLAPEDRGDRGQRDARLSERGLAGGEPL